MTDPRLVEAQERAAELVKRNRELDKPYSTALAGWAEAMVVLAKIKKRCDAYPEVADTLIGPGRLKLMDTAITKFCGAMLGGRDD